MSRNFNNKNYVMLVIYFTYSFASNHAHSTCLTFDII